MTPDPIDPKTQKDVVNAGLEREKKMLELGKQGKLGPTMTCVFDNSIKDPLAFLSREEMQTLGKMFQRQHAYRRSKKYGVDAPFPLFTADEKKLFVKARSVRPTREERLKEKQLKKKLELELSTWEGPLQTELKGMEPEAKKVVEQARREWDEDMVMSEGEEDPTLDAEDIDLEVFDEIEEDPQVILPPLMVDFLDVGMGDSTLFVCGDGTTVLIDCGTTSNIKTGAIDALAFLQNRLVELQSIRKLKKPKIDRIYITHADRDHYNLLPTLFHLLPDLQVAEFHIGGEQNDYKEKLDVLKIKETKGETLPVMADLFAKGKVVEYPAEYTGDPKHTLTSKASVFGEAVTFRTLCANSVPTHGEEPTNAASVVVLVEMPVNDEKALPVKILMMGDGEISVENVLLKEHPDDIENSSLLHVGHHGSQIAANDGFLKVVDPRIAQISADQNWAHPYRETVERITGTPGLRLNEAMESDATHPIIYGEGNTRAKTRVHTQIDTRSELIMNVSEQEVDTVSDRAKTMHNANKTAKKPEDVITPMTAHGEQWRVVFHPDGSHEKFSTWRDPNTVLL